APDAIVSRSRLACGDALDEPPTALLQYPLERLPSAEEGFRVVIAPARGDDGLAALRPQPPGAGVFVPATPLQQQRLPAARGCIEVETPDPWFDAFVNHWLPRQVFYHGDSNRLTTDPQTRNYLQDHMGMAYLDPQAARAALLRALS